MKTLLASIVSLGFLTSIAVACPHMEEQTKQAEKKDTKGDTKSAQAKPAPAPAPKPAPAPAPKPAPAPPASKG